MVEIFYLANDETYLVTVTPATLKAAMVKTPKITKNNKTPKNFKVVYFYFKYHYFQLILNKDLVFQNNKPHLHKHKRFRQCFLDTL